jgi:hypothetical protein
VWSGTYDLPFGRGKALLKGANRVLDYAVGGWNVNLITTFTTGTALGWGNLIYTGGPLNLNPHNVDNSFDVTQFNRVSAQQLGSNVRTFPTRFANLRQDSVQQVDFSIIKGLRISERVRMTYRCEFFNSTNRAIFNPPDLVTRPLSARSRHRRIRRAAYRWLCDSCFSSRCKSGGDLTLWDFDTRGMICKSVLTETERIYETK